MKTCSTCKQVKPLTDFYKDKRTPDGLKSQCKKCHTICNIKTRNINNKRENNRNFMRNAREKNPDKFRKRELEYEKNRSWDEKREARYQLNLALRRGEILKPDACEDCGETVKLTAHHDNYFKPLEVRWLCYECHGKRHRKIS